MVHGSVSGFSRLQNLKIHPAVQNDQKCQTTGAPTYQLDV